MMSFREVLEDEENAADNDIVSVSVLERVQIRWSISNGIVGTILATFGDIPQVIAQYLSDSEIIFITKLFIYILSAALVEFLVKFILAFYGTKSEINEKLVRKMPNNGN